MRYTTGYYRLRPCLGYVFLPLDLSDQQLQQSVAELTLYLEGIEASIFFSAQPGYDTSPVPPVCTVKPHVVLTVKVSACWRALSEHQHFCRLTTPEKLQMINHRPLQPVAVHLVSGQTLTTPDCRESRQTMLRHHVTLLMYRWSGSMERKLFACNLSLSFRSWCVYLVLLVILRRGYQHLLHIEVLRSYPVYPSALSEHARLHCSLY